MISKNLYIVQVKEALNFYKNYHVEYKRLSLILLDNIIEVILKSKVFESFYRLNLSEIEINSKIKSCEFFANLTKESSQIGLISNEERLILDFTHDIRNTQFHEPYPTEFSHLNCKEKLIEFGVLSNIEFLISKSSVLINLKSDIVECYPCGFETLSEKVGFKQPDSLILMLKEVVLQKVRKPSVLLSDIIHENITLIKDFFESEAQEDWNEFRKLALESFSYHLTTIGKEISQKEIENFPKVNDSKLEKLILRQKNTENKSVEKAIECYRTFQNEYGSLMKGIATYQLLNSNYDEYD